MLPRSNLPIGHLIIESLLRIGKTFPSSVVTLLNRPFISVKFTRLLRVLLVNLLNSGLSDTNYLSKGISLPQNAVIASLYHLVGSYMFGNLLPDTSFIMTVLSISNFLTPLSVLLMKFTDEACLMLKDGALNTLLLNYLRLGVSSVSPFVRLPKVLPENVSSKLVLLSINNQESDGKALFSRFFKRWKQLVRFKDVILLMLLLLNRSNWHDDRSRERIDGIVLPFLTESIKQSTGISCRLTFLSAYSILQRLASAFLISANSF